MGVIWVVEYHPAVVREDIPKLGGAERERIKSAIERKLATDPARYGIPLRHSLKNHRKLRVGDYRIVFRVSRSRVRILAIQHRSVVWKRINRRLDA